MNINQSTSSAKGGKGETSNKKTKNKGNNYEYNEVDCGRRISNMSNLKNKKKKKDSDDMFIEKFKKNLNQQSVSKSFVEKIKCDIDFNMLKIDLNKENNNINENQNEEKEKEKNCNKYKQDRHDNIKKNQKKDDN